MTVSPLWQGWYENRDACMQQAQKANANDPRLKHPGMDQYKPRYVCLKAEPDA